MKITNKKNFNNNMYANYSDKDLVKLFTAETIRTLSKDQLTQLFQETYNRKCAEYGVEKPCKVKIGTSFLMDDDYTTNKKIFFNYKKLKNASTETAKLQSKFSELNANNVGLFCYNSLNMFAYYDRINSLKSRFENGKELTENEKITFAISYAYKSIVKNYEKAYGKDAGIPHQFKNMFTDSDLTTLHELKWVNTLKNAGEFEKIHNINDYDMSKQLMNVASNLLVYANDEKEWGLPDKENFNKTGEIRDSKLTDILSKKEEFAMLVNSMFKDAVESPLDKEVLEILNSSLKIDENGNSKYRSMIIDDIKLAKLYCCRFKKAKLAEDYVNNETNKDIPMNI